MAYVQQYILGGGAKEEAVSNDDAPASTGGINVKNFQWGPGNQYAYDPATDKYYMGANGDVAWGVTPNSGDPNAVGSIGSTMYSTREIAKKAWDDWIASKGGKYNLGEEPTSFSVVDRSSFSDIPPEKKKFFAPGATIQSWDASLGAPKAEIVKAVPNESEFSQLMGGSSDPNSSFGGKPWWGFSPFAAMTMGVGSMYTAAGGAALANAGAAGVGADAAAEGAFGAMGAGTSAIGGTEALASLGGSATGAGGVGLPISGAINYGINTAAKGVGSLLTPKQPNGIVAGQVGKVPTITSNGGVVNDGGVADPSLVKTTGNTLFTQDGKPVFLNGIINSAINQPA